MTVAEFMIVAGGFVFVQVAVATVRATREQLARLRDRKHVMTGLMWIENSPDCAVFARDRRVLIGVDPSTLAPDPEAIESCAHVHFHPAEADVPAQWLGEVWFIGENGAEVRIVVTGISKDHTKRICEALAFPIYRTTSVLANVVAAVPRMRS